MRCSYAGCEQEATDMVYDLTPQGEPVEPRPTCGGHTGYALGLPTEERWERESMALEEYLEEERRNNEGDEFTQCENFRCGQCDGCVTAADQKYHALKDEGLI